MPPLYPLERMLWSTNPRITFSASVRTGLVFRPLETSKD